MYLNKVNNLSPNQINVFLLQYPACLKLDKVRGKIRSETWRWQDSCEMMSERVTVISTVLTPKRHQFSTMNNVSFPGSPPMKDVMMFPWNWGEGAGKIQLSPSSSCGSPEANSKDSLRRGRPRADSITSLILEGSSSPSSIKCHICNRVFPREKSLQAHLRTHTGERPYQCDYPSCGKAFAQSGQLKTHQRLHTGEKPFICTAQGCQSRFTHANRHCPDHPYATLRRIYDNAVKSDQPGNENNNEVVQWLEKYQRERDERVPTKLRDRKLKRELDQQAQLEEEIPVKKGPNPVDTCQANQRHPQISEQQDKWIGALALIQLAEAPEIQPLNLSFHK